MNIVREPPDGFQPTETLKFENFHRPSDGTLVLEVQNDTKHFAWRLSYEGGVKGQVGRSYSSLYEFDGWGLVTAYYEGTIGLKPFVPFRVTSARRVK